MPGSDVASVLVGNVMEVGTNLLLQWPVLFVAVEVECFAKLSLLPC